MSEKKTQHDRLADDAILIALAIREEDPNQLHTTLTNLCARRPAEGAQLIMALAAMMPVDEPHSVTVARVESITTPRMAAAS